MRRAQQTKEEGGEERARERKGVVSLLRVSTEQQAGEDRFGIPAQRRVVREIIEREGLALIEEVEIHHSGARVLEDPKFRALIERVRTGDLYGVVVADPDRLMRPDDLRYYGILQDFRDSGTHLFTSKGKIDLERDRMVTILESEFANLEREAIQRRTQRGKEELRRQGRKAEGGGIPRGVAYDHRSGRWSYVFPGAARVRDAFRLFLYETTHFAEIARRTGLVAGKSMRALLSQKLYAGVYRVDRRWKNGRSEPRPAEQSFETQVIEEPLVSLEEFERVQELLEQKRLARAPRRSRHRGPVTYAGHLLCASCGAHLWALESRRNGRSYWTYSCGNRRGQQCSLPQIGSRSADAQLDLALESLLGEEDSLRQLVEASVQTVGRPNAEAAAASETLLRLRHQRKRIQEGFVAGLFTVAEAHERQRKLQAESGRAERCMREAARPIKLDAKAVRDIVESFALWSFHPRDVRQELLRLHGVKAAVSVSGTKGQRQVEVRELELAVLGLRLPIGAHLS